MMTALPLSLQITLHVHCLWVC